MSSSPGRYIVLLLLCAVIVLPLRSQEKPPAKKSTATKTSGSETKPASSTESKKIVDLKKMDLSSLPADAVIVICEHGDEALDLVPKAVILRPDKYQKMRDEIEQLKKQLQSEKPTTPTRCVLRGKVESGAVRVEAEFAGTTERADTLVSLACPQAGASSAETDGRMALIQRSESGGFLVRIDKAGEYRVKLDLIVPLAVREGNGRGFELTLPRAVITQLELDLPANVKDVRVGGRLVDDRFAGLKLENNRRLSGNPGLEPVDKLDLSWKEVHRPMGEPVRTAEGRIQVRLDAAVLTTEADLTLKVEGAATNVWRLLVPLKAEVRVLSPDEGRVKTPIETTDQKFASLRTIHLKEASSDPLHVRVTVSPRSLDLSRPTYAVGPFFVLDAARQMGTVVVHNRMRHLHLDYRGHGDMRLRRQQTEENGETAATVATLVYSNITMGEKLADVGDPKLLSWLELTAETVRPQVRTRVAHTLTLRRGDSSVVPSLREGTGTRGASAPHNRDALRWQIATTIAAATKWTDIEKFKVFVPPSSAFRVLSPEWKVQGKEAVYSLSPQLGTQNSPLRLEGQYEAHYGKEGRAVLKLPRPQGTVESCEVKIEAPADCEVVVNNAEQANLELSKQTRANEQTWRCRVVPPDGQEIDVSWRPYRPQLRVMSVVDLTLNGNKGDVRHELRLQLPPAPPAVVNLRVPPGIDDFRVESEGWRVERKDKETRRQGDKEKETSDSISLSPCLPVSLSETKEWRLVLRYTTPLSAKDQTEKRAAESGKPFAVPLIVPQQATAGDLKVRIWSEAGFPRLGVSRQTQAHWQERGIEEVKDRRDLPVLVLQSTRLDAPLLLVAGEQTKGFSVLVERALLRVRLRQNGVQNWRASFQLRQLADGHLDILLPAPIALLNAQFFFNRRKVAPDIVNERGERSEGGNVARLHLSADLIRQTALLEVAFQSLPGRTSRSLLHTDLQPPRIEGAPAAPTRWQVSIPDNRVLIAPESASSVERTGTWRGWLVAAGLQSTPVDSEREWDDSLPAELKQDAHRLDSEGQAAPALVCWQDQIAPIVLTHVPQQGWLLLCSLGLLTVGLGLYWTARPRDGGHLAAWFWALLALLILAAAVAALLWPTMLWAIVYGCEPGAVVLLGAIALQWTVYQRYRRQIVFLPSFSRSRAGSSLVRKTPSHRPPSGEPSTVDAPPPS